MNSVISIFVDVLSLTLILALAAFGLAIIFGLIGVINMGHGALLTLGAYFTWAATSLGHVPFFWAVLLATLAVGLVGLILEHTLIRYFYDRPVETLLITWGFFLVTTELIKIIFGTDLRSVVNPLPGSLTIGQVVLPAYRSLIAAVSLVVIGGSAIVLYRTTLGIKIRAMIQNREVASLLGLNIGLMYKGVFVAGACLAGFAGALLSPTLSVDPYIGNIYLVRSFFVVTVGGVGQILGGTLIGSLLIGGSETLFALFSSQEFAQTIVFALAILVLRFRPAGILTRK